MCGEQRSSTKVAKKYHDIVFEFGTPALAGPAHFVPRYTDVCASYRIGMVDRKHHDPSEDSLMTAFERTMDRILPTE